jgi:hypothetical protein
MNRNGNAQATFEVLHDVKEMVVDIWLILKLDFNIIKVA